MTTPQLETRTTKRRQVARASVWPSAWNSPAEVDATYEKLVAAGYHGHSVPWDAVWGQRYALIHDPDGNSVDLFAPLPAGDAR